MKQVWDIKACYAVLGIPTTATERQVKSAYRKMVLKHHPDTSKEQDAVIKFKLLHLAYNTILNKLKQPNSTTGLRDTSEFETALHTGEYKDFDKRFPGKYPGKAAGRVIDMGDAGYFDADGFYHGHRYEQPQLTLLQAITQSFEAGSQLPAKTKKRKMKRKRGR